MYNSLSTAKTSKRRGFLPIKDDIIDSQMRLYSNRDNPEVQKIIDEAFAKIVSTKLGNVICSYTTSRPLNLMMQLGVSQNQAKVISQICENIKPNSDQNKPAPLKSPKIIYFVFNLDKNFPFHSWTDMDNETYIFFNDMLSLEEIYARLIHEYFIANDAKLQLSSEMGLNLDYWYQTKIINTGFNKEKNIRNIFGILPFPAIKYSLAIVRAMDAERVILKELFPGVIKSAKLENAKVFELLEHNRRLEAIGLAMRTLLPLQDYLLPAEYLIVPINERKMYAANLYLNEEATDLALKFFKTSKLQFKDKYGTLNLVEWLTTPTLGIHASFFSRGPRPRVGGGWAQDKDFSQNYLEERRSLKQPTGRTDVLYDLEGFKRLQQIKNNQVEKSPYEIPSNISIPRQSPRPSPFKIPTGEIKQ